MNRTKIISFVAIAIIVLAVTVDGVLLFNNYSNTKKINSPLPENKAANNETKPTETVTESEKPNFSYFKAPKIEDNRYSADPVPNANVDWNGSPLQLPDPDLIIGLLTSDNTIKKVPELKYFDLGSHNGNKIILCVAPPVEMGSDLKYFFEKTSNGYVFMAKMSDYTYSEEIPYTYILSPNIISADNTTYYTGMTGPNTILLNGIKIVNSSKFPLSLFSQYQQEFGTSGTFEKIGSTAYGEIYLEKYQKKLGNGKDAIFFLTNYNLRLPSGFYSSYQQEFDFFADNNNFESVLEVTWNDGTKNTDKYSKNPALGGCGNYGSIIMPIDDISKDIRPAGVTNTGETLYEFSDTSNRNLRFFYDLIGGTIYDYDTQQQVRLTLEEWNSHHPVVVYKNLLGNYIIFTNQRYGLMAECAKPVIYLYPEKNVNVSVRVGANITKSEPAYNSGWQVEASPDGKLINGDGKIYDSLFWDGIGYGNYPEIKEGFVVEQSKLKETIQSNLQQLGLNEKESTDFMDFWTPKMPSTKYVRLTWFTTDQINNLAPLNVFPRPDTFIRIFLDFEGLNEKISIPAQKLSSVNRNGFTLIEWGGLLRAVRP